LISPRSTIAFLGRFFNMLSFRVAKSDMMVMTLDKAHVARRQVGLRWRCSSKIWRSELERQAMKEFFVLSLTMTLAAGTATAIKAHTISRTQARETEQARTRFKCVTNKVIMTDKAGLKGSVQVEQHMTFSIDDAAKAFIFSDGRPLRVTRFDKSWISGNSEDIQYEFNRADGTLTYAGSTTKDNVTTTIVGSGVCEDASTEKT
jgi:hypothetical protein